MIVFLASRLDKAAQGLVDRWHHEDAAMLTVEDLSAPGWRHYPGDARSSQSVVSGRVVPTDDIHGVVVRRPRVFPGELAHIVERDREYVAAEMSAFLLSWLSGLACPLFNPPTPTCLCGPNWSQPQWVWTAARLGIPVRSVRIRVPSRRQERDVSVAREDRIAMTVLDGQCFGTGDELMAEQAWKLATAAGVRTLTTWFGAEEDSPAFLSADPLPNLSDEAMVDALRLTLRRRS